ncbi:Protein of unknown function [Bacillus wiedmannii]|uniref:Uncharacterized protein n=1 Tax=Bacillus wiedmannii TaxID=1890302 RepID=A0A1C4DP89_9BACI|nr:Protein of unknown function [Bacillus wiedmannii]SCN04694.1 Protein of unknown function [Bacillus wiedmannii]
MNSYLEALLKQKKDRSGILVTGN